MSKEVRKSPCANLANKDAHKDKEALLPKEGHGKGKDDSRGMPDMVFTADSYSSTGILSAATPSSSKSTATPGSMFSKAGFALPKLPWGRGSNGQIQPTPSAAAAAATSPVKSTTSPTKGAVSPVKEEEQPQKAASSPSLKTEAASPKAAKTDSLISKEAASPKATKTDSLISKASTAGAEPSRWSLDDFKIVKTVGTGFIGSVRVVKLSNATDQSPFALKVMKKAQVIKRKQATHVMQEVELLRKVDHPFVVRLLTTFQDEAHLFMCMDFVNGGELFNVIKRVRKLAPDVSRFYAGEIVLALGHIHSFDIVYRDLKPENILIDSGGHCKIADFGFAKVVTTRTWTVCGTPEYVAPEIITRKGHSKPVDWWAVGILTFEMLTGRAPFRGQNSQDIYSKILGAEPAFPPNLKEKVQNFIGELLNKDKTRRLGSGVGGVDEVKGHTWFSMVDWDVLLNRKYAAPMTPTLKGPDDTSLFDDYPEEPIEASSGPRLTAEEQKLFEGF